MFWNILEVFRIFQKVLECLRMSKKVLECIRRLYSVLEGLRMFQNFPESFITVRFVCNSSQESTRVMPQTKRKKSSTFSIIHACYF
jgi:hypothetical protein